MRGVKETTRPAACQIKVGQACERAGRGQRAKTPETLMVEASVRQADACEAVTMT